VNKVLLTGRLTRDPELRSLASGKTVTQFGIATNAYRANGQEKSEFHNVVTWDSRLLGGTRPRRDERRMDGLLPGNQFQHPRGRESKEARQGSAGRRLSDAMEPTDDLDVRLGDLPDLPYDPVSTFDRYTTQQELLEEKLEYDYYLDAAFEYETQVIEKGIRKQANDRARKYLSENGDALWRRIDKSLGDAKPLIATHAGASLTLSMTAAELTVRFMILRPLLAGLVIDPVLADRLAALATQGLAGRDRELLPHVCQAWGIDLKGQRIWGTTRELWSTYGTLWQIRHDFIHRGTDASTDVARTAVSCADAIIEQVLIPLTKDLSRGWPGPPWLLDGDAAKDPLTRAKSNLEQVSTE
jgi:hypothetical protein